MKTKSLLWLLCILSVLLLAACGQQAGNGTFTGTSETSDDFYFLQTTSKKVGDLQITNAPDNQSQPDVTYDSINNRYLTVWVNATDSTGFDIMGGFANAATNDVDFEFAISTAAKNQTQPRAAFDTQNERFLVVWTDTRNEAGQIYGQFINAISSDPSQYGSLVGANFLISQDVGETVERYIDNGLFSSAPTSGVTNAITLNLTPEYQSQESPSVVFNEVTGEFMVAWTDNTDTDYKRIYDRANVSNSVCSQDFGDNDSAQPDTTDDKNIFYVQYVPT